MKMSKRDRVRAQVKSRWYYTFWGTATVAVVAGQLYVGTSYRTCLLYTSDAADEL